MKLHEDSKLFRQAVEATAQQMGIPSIYVEKDYWVTHALHVIFHHPIGKETVFKGGTALSKCFGLIDRFSEDIDLVVLRRKGETNNQLTTKVRTISRVVSAVLPEVQVENMTQKRGMIRKTAHTYSKEFSGEYGQVRVIVVEATWLGHHEPFMTKNISSLVYGMMKATDQLGIAEENGLLPFELRALDPKRTICEKIMSLVRFSYSEAPIGNLRKKIRHTYDLHQLLKQSELSDFFHSHAFEEMLLKVAQDDVVSFKNSNAWLAHHPNKALLFAELKTTWNELKPTYNHEFRNLVFGNFPKDAAILNTLTAIKLRLKTVRWTVDLGV